MASFVLAGGITLFVFYDLRGTRKDSHPQISPDPWERGPLEQVPLGSSVSLFPLLLRVCISLLGRIPHSPYLTNFLIFLRLYFQL